MDEDASWLVSRVAATLLGTDSRVANSPEKLLAGQALSGLSPSRNLIAFSWQQNLAIVDLIAIPGSPGSTFRAALTPHLEPDESVTALSWVAVSADGISRVDQQFLILGTSLGYLQVHNFCGRLLHRAQLHRSPCCSIRARAQGQGLDASSCSEDVTVCFADAVVLIPGSEVLSLGIQAGRLKSDAEALTHALNTTRWDLPKCTGPRSFALCLGSAQLSLYEKLSGRTPVPRLSFLSAGRSPSLACFEAPEMGSDGVLALVSELASGVAGLAKTLVKGRPNGIRAGLGNWMGRAKPGGESAGRGEAENVAGPPGHPSSLISSFADNPRSIGSMQVAPRGSLAAAADSLGRVLLLDTASMTVVRLWKAYRHAQIAWLVLPTPANGSTSALHRQESQREVVLLLYSPKRCLLEVWQPRLGKRLCCWQSSRYGLLLQAPAIFGFKASPQGPYFLDCERGKLWDVCELFLAKKRDSGP